MAMDSFSFPHYMQMDAMDCGPAALKIIARYYGKSYSIQTLRDYCYITKEGVSMQGIAEAAERIGFRTLGVKLTFDKLADEAPLPCILHWNQNHFVVCYKIKRRHNHRVKIYISDPASGKITYEKGEFMRCWAGREDDVEQNQGLALLLEPGCHFYNDSTADDTSQLSIKYLIDYFRPFSRQLFLLLLLLLCGTVLQFAPPLLTQVLVDKGIRDSNIDFIVIVLLAQLLLAFSQTLSEFLSNRLSLFINTKVGISLISDFLANLMRMPLRFFDAKNTGDIMQRIKDNDRIKRLLMGSSTNILFSTLTFLVFASVLGYYHLLILSIFLTGNAIYVSWVLFFMHRRRELDIRRFNQAAAEQSNLIQLVQGMQDIKLNNCECKKRWEWERIQRLLYHIDLRSLQLGQWQQAGSLLFSQTTNIVITFIAAKAVVDSKMTLGMMMSLTYIIGMVTAPIHAFINFTKEFQDANISFERLNEIQKIQEIQKQLPEKERTIIIGGDIIIKNLWFSYSGAKRGYALKNITLTIPSHKVTALVGTSGSGKTTLIKILLGFYKQLEGEVNIGIMPLEQINTQQWRNKTGAVLQDSYIFSDTIAHNIAMSDEAPDKQKILGAIQMANIDEYILSLPLGLRTKIGSEGVGLSQGQRQRILIARVIYKNPDYIFLDEATNALDSINEKTINNNLREFYNGRTVVIAAHRLSTVKEADLIVVLDKGCVVEKGTHTELVQQKGAYYSLIKNQLEF